MTDYFEYSAPELVKLLGSRFKDYRLRANLTQKEVAETTGLSILTIHRFENGTVNNISLATFLLLMKAVGCINDLDALMPKVARYGAALYDGEDAPTLARILQER